MINHFHIVTEEEASQLSLTTIMCLLHFDAQEEASQLSHTTIMCLLHFDAQEEALKAWSHCHDAPPALICLPDGTSDLSIQSTLSVCAGNCLLQSLLIFF